MIAEIKGKIAPDSTQALDRLEDLLTSYVFGAVKYLPRQVVLRAVLERLCPELRVTDDDLDEASIEFWPTFEQTEPDVVVRAGRTLIVFEAKLWSGFGEGQTQADDQLIREYSTTERVSGINRLNPPIIVAVTADYTEPAEVEAANRFLGTEDSMSVRWTNWQALADVLESTKTELSVNEQSMIDDVLDVMEKRGVRRMFDGFAEEDYWLLAAAQRRSAEAVYPTIATFCEQLQHDLSEHGITRAVSENRIFTHQSFSFNQPDKWGAGFLYLPLRGDHWPDVEHWKACVFVQFSLRDPKISIGYRHQIRKKDIEAWRRETPTVLDGLRSFEGHTIAGVKYPDYHLPIDATPSTAVDEEWIERLISGAEIRLVVYRDLPLSALSSTDAVAQMLSEDLQGVGAAPVLFESLLT